MQERLPRGNACGALTVGRAGSNGTFANRADVEAFIRLRTRR